MHVSHILINNVLLCITSTMYVYYVSYIIITLIKAGHS